MSTADMHLDMGALALGALPDEEALEAEQHVATCDSCTAELAGFRETVVLLGSVAAEAPPASLRRSVMAAIRTTPQLPPLVVPSPVITSTEPAHAAPSQDEAPSTPPSNVVPLRPWYRRPQALIAAAVAALVIGGGTVVAVNQLGGTGQEVAQTPEQCVAQATDKQQLVPDTGSGTATYAASCNAVTLDVTGLPDLPSDQTYQLWALAGQTPRSLGLLDQASQGESQLVTKTTNPGESVVAITAEPAAGSPAPTGDIIWKTTLNA